MSAGRWIARLLLIVLLVELGLSVPGAILGSIGASLIEITIGQRYVRLSLFHRAPVPAPPLFWRYVLPLFLSALSLSCYNRLDLFALKVLGGTAVQACTALPKICRCSQVSLPSHFHLCSWRR